MPNTYPMYSEEIRQLGFEENELVTFSTKKYQKQQKQMEKIKIKKKTRHDKLMWFHKLPSPHPKSQIPS